MKHHSFLSHYLRAFVDPDILPASPVQQTAATLHAEIHYKPLEMDAILDLTGRLLDSGAGGRPVA